MSVAEGRPPALSNSSLLNIINKFYNFDFIDANSIKHLPGYDDRNFYFIGTPTASSTSTEFVLKIFNSLHFEHEEIVGISEIWSHVARKGFNYCSCLQNINGKTISFVSKSLCEESASCSSGTYAIRILHYVVGEMFDEVDKCYLMPKLLQEAGAFLGKLDAALQEGFHNTALVKRKNLDWDLYHLLHLRVHIPSMDNISHRIIVTKILNYFESFVQPKIPSFSKGIIHGDANGMNVVIRKNDLDEYQIVGLIDFDDSVFSCHIFDIAIFLTYAMMENLNPIDNSSPVEFVCPLLQGYLKEFQLSWEEVNCLYYLALGRCCQSAVLGEIAYKAESWNTYLLKSSEKAYKLIELLLAMGKEKVDKIWSEAVLKI